MDVTRITKLSYDKIAKKYAQDSLKYKTIMENLLKIIANNGFSVIGIDFSPKMDMRKLEFADNTFDGIWASASLLHIPKKQIGIVMSELKRVLKPEGVMFIGLKEGKGEKIETTDYCVPRFFAYYTKKEIESILNNYGFKILKFIVKKGEKYSGNWLDIFVRLTK